MSFLKKLIILPALLVLIEAEYPFEYKEDEIGMTTRVTATANYRLPEELDPIHCNIEITPYFTDAPTGKEPFTFDGEATWTVKALKDNLNVLTIHENVRDIVSVAVYNASQVEVLLNNPSIVRVRTYNFLEINLANGVTLKKGDEYTLKVAYTGNINETPLSRGMFRGSYKDSTGRVRWYSATHLQPTHSRQLFPSFDEPGFKSTYNITVNRPANFAPTFSNMPMVSSDPVNINGDRIKEVFQTTPRMSAYLISIHISEEFTVIADNNDAIMPYRIIGRPNAKGQGEYALEVGPPITKWLANYFGIEYYTMADGLKNDQLASPDWASGATENWGLVSYRELRLLYEEGETNAADKMSIGTITAHELAHKWFGNYITCRWWDNVWINEGFASYFEYFAMDGVDRTLELEDQFNIMYVQSSLSSDSSSSTRALRHTVNSPTEVTGHFSGISYSKGASLLLMLKHFIGEETFKKALNLFLVDRAYEPAFPEDLYSAFDQATTAAGGLIDNVNITTFMNYWVDEQGSPILTAKVNMETGRIDLKQERFFISSSTPQTKQVWQIPLTYTTGKNPDWNNLTPSEVLLEKTGHIDKKPGHEWVIFNVQQKGLYRVNYDSHNWEMIAEALKQNVSNIHHLNRAQIVDDIFALMRSEKISFKLGFQVLEFLKQDTSYYSWYPAITGFSWYRNRFIHMPDTLAEYDEIMYEYLDAVIKEVGYNVQPGEALTRTLNRFYTLSFACNIGHSGCINDAVKKFKDFRGGASVDPNLRRHVFCTGLREGGYEDWKTIYERRLNSNNQADGVAMLRALGCSSDDKAVQEYLQMVISDDVKAQDRLNAFTFLYTGDRANAKPALQFLKNNVDAIRKAVVLPASFNSVLSTLASYLDEEGLKDMEEWLNNNKETVPEYQSGLNAITSSRNSMKWGTDHADIVLKALRGSAAMIMPTVTLLLATLLAMMLK